MTEQLSQFDNLTVIRENQRFKTLRGERAGEPIYIKATANPSLRKNIQDEAWGLETFAQIIKLQSIESFRAPKLIENGGTYIVTSWAEGETMQLSQEADDVIEKVDQLTQVYADIDRATQLVHPGKTKLEDFPEKIQARLNETAYRDYFTEEDIQGGLEFLNRHIPQLESRLTHADLTPHNILDNEGTLTVIDFESVSMLLPRFYDLVNYTFNTTMYSPDFRPMAVNIIKSFFDKINSSAAEHTAQLNTIAMVRALSIVAETLTPPNELHNTAQELDEPLARRLKHTLAYLQQPDVFFLPEF